MPTDVLRECWDALLRRYHARLSAAGVCGYGLEQCRFHYRQSLYQTTRILVSPSEKRRLSWTHPGTSF
jgi:hypothetical protein